MSIGWLGSAKGCRQRTSTTAQVQAPQLHLRREAVANLDFGHGQFGIPGRIADADGKLQLVALDDALDPHPALSALGTELRIEGDQLIERTGDQIALHFHLRASRGTRAGMGKGTQINRQEFVEGKIVKMDEAVNFGNVGRLLVDFAQRPA